MRICKPYIVDEYRIAGSSIFEWNGQRFFDVNTALMMNDKLIVACMIF